MSSIRSFSNSGEGVLPFTSEESKISENSSENEFNRKWGVSFDDDLSIRQTNALKESAIDRTQTSVNIRESNCSKLSRWTIGRVGHLAHTVVRTITAVINLVAGLTFGMVFLYKPCRERAKLHFLKAGVDTSLAITGLWRVLMSPKKNISLKQALIIPFMHITHHPGSNIDEAISNQKELIKMIWRVTMGRL